MKVLITGGAGFIGSHVVKHFLADSRYHVYNLDKLTYAGNPNNLTGLEKSENYTFVHGDITDASFVQTLFEKHQFKHIIHLAAESHVDRSIADPIVFAKTNILGTLNLKAKRPKNTALEL
ncbi:MAG: GDP-mannose 4,6-dehydratase [Flavobacteriaceae bacterium]